MGVREEKLSDGHADRSADVLWIGTRALFSGAVHPSNFVESVCKVVAYGLS
jgi:hypothetical protein